MIAPPIPTSPHRIRHSGITVGEQVRERLGIHKEDAKSRSGHISDAAHEIYMDSDLSHIRRLTEGVAQLIDVSEEPSEAPQGPRRAPRKRSASSAETLKRRLTEL